MSNKNDKVIEYCGFKFLTDNSMASRMINNWYEKQEISLIEKIPNLENLVILELGGCLGVVSVVSNSRLKNKKNHVVVEANPNLMNYLNYNKKINDCHFKIENAMISSTSDGVFYSFDKIVAGSAHRTDNKERNKTKHIVDVMTYDELEKKHNLKFDVLIIDIEGGELEFLQEIKTNSYIKYIMIELHESQMFRGFDAECIDTLNRMGMNMISKNGQSYLFGR